MPQAASQKTRQQQGKVKGITLKHDEFFFFVPIYFPLLMSVCFILENVCVRRKKKNNNSNSPLALTSLNKIDLISEFLRGLRLKHIQKNKN